MNSKRTRILQTARDEFLLHGYDGTSIDSIVREVGGSKSTVYAHFPDKGILFAETLAEASREMDFSLSAAQAEPAEDLLEGLALLLVELQSILYRERVLHLMRLVVAESGRFPDVAAQFLKEGPERAIEAIADYIRERASDPKGFAREPAETARSLYALVTGIEYLRVILSVEDPPTSAEIVSRAKAALAVQHRYGI